MYINQTSNEYHHLKVSWIDDYSNDLQRNYIRMRCTGRVMYRNPACRNGYKVYGYQIYVYVSGRLMDYVKSEIQNGDNIFVIGRTVMRKPNKYNVQRALTAECIYREEWLNFYAPNGNANPIDYADVYKEIMKEYDE